MRGGFIFLIFILCVLSISCSQRREVPFTPSIDFGTLCMDNDVTRLNDVIEQHVRYTRSLNESSVWLRDQACVHDAHVKPDGTMEVKFDFSGEIIYLRVRLVENEIKK